jgi:hypothetical protein
MDREFSLLARCVQTGCHQLETSTPATRCIRASLKL